VTLHVETRGHGPDVVLLHGWGLHGGMWGPWLNQLARNARLHLVDLPGHGRSPWRPQARDLTGLARAVLPRIPAHAAIIGWSLGGMVALELARQHREHVRALVLLATTPKFVAGDGWEHGLKHEVLDTFARGLAHDYRRTVQSFLTLQTRGDERSLETLRQLRRRLTAHGEPDQHGLAAGLDILRRSDLRSSLPQITVPTLVFAGEHDRLTPAAAGRELAGSLPAARFCLVERSGHAPFLSHPDTVANEVRDFLARHPVGTDA
jgi:pimeloyl-[acyl-carrier protein] methyl ester esterase